jgi:hypothetical protein
MAKALHTAVFLCSKQTQKTFLARFFEETKSVYRYDMGEDNTPERLDLPSLAVLPPLRIVSSNYFCTQLQLVAYSTCSATLINNMPS